MIRHPQVNHLEEVEAFAHIGGAEHQRLRQVEPGKRVERIGVRTQRRRDNLPADSEERW